MKQTLQYSILKHERLTDMVDHVNEVISEGWEPCGGVSFVQQALVHGGGQYYVQAVRLVAPTLVSVAQRKKLDVVK